MSLRSRVLASVFAFMLLCLGMASASAQTDPSMTGAVRGTVTEAGTAGVPVTNATVTLSTNPPMPPPMGISLLATTGADGTYVIDPVPPGMYMLSFSAPFHQSTVLFSISVTAGNITFANASLQITGSISGTVRGAGGVALEPGAMVQFVARGVTDGNELWGLLDFMNGTYTIPNLVPGRYRVHALPGAGSGYMYQAYNGIPCAGPCAANVGNEVEVTGGQTTTGIDFVLSRGGAIEGTVTAEGTGAPIFGAGIEVRSETATLSTAYSGADGKYSAGGLPPGDYTVLVTQAAGYLLETYGEHVHVVADTTTANINFALEQAGSITGTLLGGADPFYSVMGNIVAVDEAGTEYQGSMGMMFGTSTVNSLKPGMYRVYTTNWSGLIDEIYADVPCFQTCAGQTGGTWVSVASGADTPVRFVLAAGGAIEGTVRVSGQATPLANVTVTLRHSSGKTTTWFTDPTGTFRFLRLPAGSYTLSTSGSIYLNETGMAVSVIDGQTTVSDIVLERGGEITGIVRDAASTLPIADAVITLYSQTSTALWSGRSDAAGRYSVPGLMAGTYFVRIDASGYVPQVYDSLPCQLLICSPTSGTPVSVVANQPTTIDIQLRSGGAITGAIAFEGPIPYNNSIDLWDSQGRVVESVRLYFGNSFTFSGLAAGTYYLTARVDGYVAQLYGGGDCQVTCNVTLGTPIGVTSGGTTGPITLTMRRGGRILGRVVALDPAGNPVPLQSVQVEASDSEGRRVKSAVVSSTDGSYAISGLATGEYYLRTASYGTPVINEVFPHIPCVGACRLTEGTRVVVTAPNDTSGRDFELTLGGSIAGVFTDENGARISQPRVTVYDVNGVVRSDATVISGGSYRTTTGLPTGTYFVRTANNAGYVNEAAGGEICLDNCNITATTPVEVTAGEVTPLNFVLSKGSIVSGTVTDANGFGVRNTTVSVVDSTGTQVIGAMTSDSGAYQTSAGLPPGRYYARTGNSIGLVNEFFDNAPCADSCSPDAVDATPIVVESTGTVSGINFALELDADADGDGITDTIDDDRANASDAFSDTRQAGTTDGVVRARNGRSVAVNDVAAGVNIVVSGTGTAPTEIDVCSASGHETLLMDAPGERAQVSCTAEGTATVAATAAYPTLELRKTYGEVTTVIELGWRQTASMGSPISAASTNSSPMRVRLLDASGAPVATFDLDPGEKVDATVAAGELKIEMLAGTSAITIAGQSAPVRLLEGDSIAAPVGDNKPPIISAVTSTPGTLWPPNHHMVPVALTVIASDNSGTPTCTITSITSNEPIDGTGDGDTSPDWFITGSMTAELRAERAGTGDGRTYTLAIACADASGNVARTNATVAVLKSRK